jgi:hypothetical protein
MPAMPVFDFDVDIYNAVMLNGYFVAHKRKMHYEYTLRSLELFFRVEKKLATYPRMLVMAVCIVVRYSALLDIFLESLSVDPLFLLQLLVSPRRIAVFYFVGAEIISNADHDQAPQGWQFQEQGLEGRGYNLPAGGHRRGAQAYHEGTSSRD